MPRNVPGRKAKKTRPGDAQNPCLRRLAGVSPAYDINPDCYGNGLNLTISDIDNSQSLDLAREVAAYFRLDRIEADQIIDQVRDAASRWRVEATNMGIPRHEQQRMEAAFRFC